MGNVKLGIFILIATILARETSAAVTWEVGDSKGWTKGVDFQKWATTFYDMVPGDTLLFKYAPGTESVVEVDKKSFEQCVVPPSAKVLKSGNDEIPLDKPGPKYFISGVENHCKEGMKFEVSVLNGGSTYSGKSSVNPAAGTSPEVFVVGDDKGWCEGVDYKAWTEGKEFDIGDKLVFKYPKGKHNVYKVSEPDWYECKELPPHIALSSGNDEVTLDAIGTNWFFSGVGKDCQKGIKLVVNVICPFAKKPAGARKLAEKH